MQFFDRPSRSKIALRGSSSRPPTSEELLARARKAREERRHRREQHQAATTIQSEWRRHRSVRDLSSRLADLPAPSVPPAARQLLHLLLAAGLLGYHPRPVLSERLRLVRQAVASRPFLPAHVRALAVQLADGSDLTSVIGGNEAYITQHMLVKACVVLLAAAKQDLETSERRSPQQPPSKSGLAAAAVSAAKALAAHFTADSLAHQSRWGLYAHLADLHSTIAAQPKHQALAKLLEPLLASLTRLLHDAPAADGEAAILHRQLGIFFLCIDGVLPVLPLLREPALVRRVMAALAGPELQRSEDGFMWDVAGSFREYSASKVAISLSNVLVLGDGFMRTRDRDMLWSYIAVLSTIIESLPQHIVLMQPGNEDDSDDEMPDFDATCGAEDSQSLREVMRRLGESLKQVVSEDTVRLLLGAAVAEGRAAVVRVCQLFNFLTRREKSLNLEFQNALAFLRSSRSTDQPHILNSLWSFCQRGDDKNLPYSSLDTSSPLREDTNPVLFVFASAYSYLLYIQDAQEMFQAKRPFSVEEVREVVLVLKHYLFSALYGRPSGVSSVRGAPNAANLLRREPGLLEEVSRLLSRLYLSDSRSKFRSGDDFWLAGRGSLSSDSFLKDAVEAGPEALVHAPEVTSFRGVRQLSYSTIRQNAVSGAGELLRVAPYLVPFSSRAKIFQSWIARERDLANGGQSFFPTSGWSVAVRRKFVFEDAFEELNGLGPELKATVRVKFIDEHGIEEAGIDGGGVFKEFMYEVLKLGFSPFSYGLFQATPDGRLYPNPDAPIANGNYKVQFAFLGRLLGKAVFDGVLVDIPLARFFLSKILGQFNYPTDLGSLDPELYKNMKFLKNCPPEVVEDLGLNFTVANNAFGTSKEVELVRNGSNIAVTASNRIEYMHRVANYRMNTQIKEQSEAFLKGFSEIVSPQYIRLFSHEELQLLISGKRGKIDLDDLRRHTKYSGGYSEETMVIKWFWQAMAELSAEDQSKLLQFVTSSPRAPLLGFSYLVPGFCIHRAEGDIRLPTASTCMNLLKLPEYKTFDVVREKLKYALQSNAGFDLS